VSISIFSRFVEFLHVPDQLPEADAGNPRGNLLN
jgi:hypothetical protein